MSNRGINDIELRELITDPAFESGVGNVYVKQDGHLWYQEPNGTKHKITPLPTGGGASGPMNTQISSSDTDVTLGTTDSVLATVTITPQRSDSFIFLIGVTNAKKDAGVTTRRIITTAINRASTLIGYNGSQQSANVASSDLAPNVNAWLDLTGTTSPITYNLVGRANAASAIITDNVTFIAVEMVGAKGEQGIPGAAGVVQSIVAGSGINVNNADPANPIVSASGGGGGLTNFTESTGSFSSRTFVALSPNNAAANVDVILSHKGTGAIIADIPDGTTAGGNARGDNAVDLQTVRSTNNRVASGTESVVCGGNGNTASGQQSTVAGGGLNQATNIQSTVSGGISNTASSGRATVSGGQSNTASGSHSTVSGGNSNIASSYGEWVGGLFLSSITANSAITYNNADRIFGIGNGTISTERSSALNIFKGGVGAAKTYINPGNDITVPTADVQVGGTTGLVLPSGTTAQRNATPTQGEMRFNTDTGKFEGWTGSAWVDFH